MPNISDEKDDLRVIVIMVGDENPTFIVLPRLIKICTTLLCTIFSLFGIVDVDVGCGILFRREKRHGLNVIRVSVNVRHIE